MDEYMYSKLSALAHSRPSMNGTMSIFLGSQPYLHWYVLHGFGPWSEKGF